MKAVREAGASDDEIRRAVEDAVALQNAATSIMKNYGRSHLGDTDHEDAAATPRDRVAELVGLGAAFAVNCVSSLENYSRHAESAGVTRAEILEIAKLAKFIKERGASHVDRWAESLFMANRKRPPTFARCGRIRIPATSRFAAAGR